MHLSRSGLFLLGALAATGASGAACDSEELLPARARHARPDASTGLPAAGTLADEQFPAELLEPYTGPPIDVYDNTFINFWQLRSRVARVFSDPGIGGNTEAYLTSKIALLGGADFVTTFNEARVATTDFLLALDALAKDACERAATNKTGPFAGADPADATANSDALVTSLYERILFRSPSPSEVGDGRKLVETLIAISPSRTSAWAGLCEALVRHPDALFTLPPSVATATGDDKQRLQLVKLTMDFLGRPPSEAELAAAPSKSVDVMVDEALAGGEFRDSFFRRARVSLESMGTPETDEPARLWATLAASGAPFVELLTADYTVDASFTKVSRPAEHGKTGVLTMPGFIKTRPGLPHYNYAARVFSDFLGQLFLLTPEIVIAREAATSTVQPGSSCFGCHQYLTPLAMQRSRWTDDGVYRTTDDLGAAIDDSDRGLVAGYAYKGSGIEAFAAQAIKKERFLRTTFQTLFAFFLGRPMRYAEDERTVYLALWKAAFASNFDTKAMLRIIASVPGYLGK